MPSPVKSQGRRRITIRSDDLFSSEGYSSSSLEDDENEETPMEATTTTRSSRGLDRLDSAPRAPQYPKQHSFVVDMNNRPLYECDRKPIKKAVSPVKKAPMMKESPRPTERRDSMAHLPPSAPTASTVYYPSKSPMNMNGALGERWGWNGPSLIVSLVGFLVLIILVGVTLGQVVSMHRDLTAVSEKVQEMAQFMYERHNGLDLKHRRHYR